MCRHALQRPNQVKTRPYLEPSGMPQKIHPPRRTGPFTALLPDAIKCRQKLLDRNGNKTPKPFDRLVRILPKSFDGLMGIQVDDNLKINT